MSPFFVACAFAFWLLFIWVLSVFVDFQWNYGHWMLFLTGVGALVLGWTYAKRRAKSKATQKSYPQRDDLEIKVAVKKKSDGVDHLGGSVKHPSLRGLSDEKFLRTRILRPNNKMHEAPASVPIPVPVPVPVPIPVPVPVPVPVHVPAPAPVPPPLGSEALTQTANNDVRVFQRRATNTQATEISQHPAFAAENGTESTPEKKPKKRTTKIFDPDHYLRHSGVPGFLYAVRNPFHQTGLYKLGYTTDSPEARMKMLNEQHGTASDVGRFELVHAVPVSDSFGAEKALFDVIADARVIEKREFFFENQDFLIRSLDAVCSFSAGSSNALTDFYELSLDRDSWAKLRPVRPPAIAVPLRSSPDGGWIFIARTMWHRDNIHRVSYSIKNPLKKLHELNTAQRNLTSQLGFYDLVACIAVDDLAGTWAALSSQLTKCRVPSSRVYYDAPLPILSQLLDDVQTYLRQPVQSMCDPEQTENLISVEKVKGLRSASWAAWSAPCPFCGIILRFKGIVGASQMVKCPECHQSMNCHQGSQAVSVRAP
jgi:T5orf172 domain